MKKNFLSGLMIAALVVSCTKSTSKTETVENPDGSVTTTTTVSESGLGVDTAKIKKIKKKTESRIDAAGEKIDNIAEDAKSKMDATADKTKENLQKAGQDIKTEANKVGKDVKDAAAQGAGKVEEGAKKLREDLDR